MGDGTYGALVFGGPAEFLRRVVSKCVCEWIWRVLTPSPPASAPSSPVFFLGGMVVVEDGFGFEGD